MEDISFCDTYCGLVCPGGTGSRRDVCCTRDSFCDSGAAAPFGTPLPSCSGFVHSWLDRAPPLLGSWRLYAAEKQAPVEAVKSPSEEPAESVVEETVKDSTTSALIEEVLDFKPTPLQIALAMAHIERETGMERVRQIFTKNHTGHNSQELNFIKETSLQALLLSFFVRFIPAYAQAKQQFINENHATVFRTHLDALRRQRDYCLSKGLQEGCRFALKICAFASSFVLVSQVVASYRNKSSPLEYVAAGAVTASILRSHMGLRGITFGVVVGGFLGGLFGCAIFGILKAGGFTQEERHLLNVIVSQEVEKSVIGDQAYQEKVKETLGDGAVL